MGKPMTCIEVETGALIFAILNVMYTALGSVLSVVGLTYTTMAVDGFMWQASEVDDRTMLTRTLPMGMAANVLFAVLTVGFCVSFSFATVLIVGICKRKAHLVKCFFVYGLLKMVVGCATLLTVFISADSGPAVLLLLFVGGIYAALLHMIRLTYLKFQSEVPFTAFANPLATVEKF